MIMLLKNKYYEIIISENITVFSDQEWLVNYDMNLRNSRWWYDWTYSDKVSENILLSLKY